MQPRCMAVVPGWTWFPLHKSKTGPAAIPLSRFIKSSDADCFLAALLTQFKHTKFPSVHPHFFSSYTQLSSPLEEQRLGWLPVPQISVFAAFPFRLPPVLLESRLTYRPLSLVQPQSGDGA